MNENIQAYTPPVVERLHGMRARIGAAVLAGSLLVTAACGGNDETQPEQAPASAGTTPSTEVVATDTTPEVCAESWEMPGVDHGDQNKWFSEGLQEIKVATNDEEARVAAAAWLNGTTEHLGIKHDSKLLIASYNEIMRPAPEAELTEEGLTDEDGCATDKTVLAVAELETRLAVSKITAVDSVPDGWLNTGTGLEGEVTIASEPGVYGDTKAILIETPDSVVVGLLGRCGQLVLPAKPANIPEGPTDNPHNPPETPPLKQDDGRLPGNPNVPADQDKGTPDRPGNGPAGQTPGDDGYLPSETRPTAPRAPDTTVETTPPNTTPATTSPSPTSTNPPVVITIPVPTIKPDPVMPVQP